MKKLIILLLLAPLFVFGQTIKGRQITQTSFAAIPVTSGLVADFDFSKQNTVVTTNYKLSQITDQKSSIISSQADTSKQPVYHLNGGVGNSAYASFRGSDILSGANIDTSSNYTLFVVRKVTVSSGINPAVFQSGSGSGNGWGWIDYSLGTYKFSGSFPSAGASPTFPTAYNRNELVILSHSHDSTVQYNISNVKFTPLNPTFNSTSPTGGHNIGYYNFAGISKGTFDAIRIIVFNRQLSDSEVAIMNLFLKNRYSLQLPYQYIGDGDSITFGTGGQPNYVTETTIDLAPTQNMYIRNIAVSGQGVDDILTHLTSRVINYYQPGVKNVYSLMIGRNGLNNTSPDTIYAHEKIVFQRIHAAGYKGIVMTALYTDTTVISNSVINAFNTLLRNDHSFADGFLDANQLTNLTNPYNTTYYADKTHITSAGAQIIATAIEPIIISL